MTVSNTIKYPNYVFANFHIQPANFLNIVFLSASLLLLRLNKPPTFLRDIKFVQKSNICKGEKYAFTCLIRLTLVFLLFYFFSTRLIGSIHTTFSNITFMTTHLNYSYDQKMRHVWGFYYDYMRFIKDNTPEDSTILIPPQDGHWLSSGNMWLTRYFLYPRRLVQGEDYKIPHSGYDYVLISKGEWQSDTIDWGWPKEIVSAEKILYIDPNTLKILEIKKDFDPNDPYNKYAWGLIKTREEAYK